MIDLSEMAGKWSQAKRMVEKAFEADGVAARLTDQQALAYGVFKKQLDLFLQFLQTRLIKPNHISAYLVQLYCQLEKGTRLFYESVKCDIGVLQVDALLSHLFSLLKMTDEIRREFCLSANVDTETESQKVFSYKICNGCGKGVINLIQGNLALTREEYDVVVCSAYKNGYSPTIKTLLGALQIIKNISVAALSMDPEIALNKKDCWISKELEGNIKRIACLELTEYSEEHDEEKSSTNDAIYLKSLFITLRYLLELADASGIAVRRIALPVLGIGEQRINMQYVVVPLFAQCIKMFSTISSLEVVDFYEIDAPRTLEIKKSFESVAAASSLESLKVFISYSTKQMEEAYKLSHALHNNGIPVWMAPESIPSGSCYLEEIPAAIANALALVLLLTEDAEASRWVRKEVSAAIGANKTVVPIQLYPFETNQAFHFLLDGEQIYPLWKQESGTLEEYMVSEIRSRIGEQANIH